MCDPKLRPSDNHELDDLDKLLLSHLGRAAVPDDFTARVLASTVARAEAPGAVVAWPWTVAGLVALAVLAIAGYNVGVVLAGSSALDVVAAVANDFDLLTAVPDQVLAAIGEVIPWWLIVLSGISAGGLVVAAGNIVSRAPAALRSQPSA